MEYFLGQFPAIKAYDWSVGQTEKKGAPDAQKIKNNFYSTKVGEFLHENSSVYGNVWYERKSDKLHTLVYFTGDFELSTVNDVRCIDASGNDDLDKKRCYANPLALAGLLGAMIECGFNKFLFRGITSSKGTGCPSTNHNNGFAIDMGYMVTKLQETKDFRMHLTSTDKNIGWPNFDIKSQKQFFKALTKFGWNYLLVYVEENKRKEIEGEGYSIIWDRTAQHYHHLHAECHLIRDKKIEEFTKEKDY